MDLRTLPQDNRESEPALMDLNLMVVQESTFWVLQADIIIIDPGAITRSRTLFCNSQF